MGKLGTATQQPASAQQQPTNSLDFLKLGVDQQQQHQQQQMIQLMAQMFGAGQAAADVQQQQFNAAAQMAQMAQMMLSAQVAAQMAASANGFGKAMELEDRKYLSFYRLFGHVQQIRQ